MAGRIRNDDVARVRDMAGIAEVIGDHVTLRPAGGGSLKGLCPFHEERSPSFHVTPAKGLYHCFGCQVGGDVIDFLERIEHLTFQEAVEKLAARFGIELRYEDSGAGPRRPQGERTRLLEAHKAAAAYYAEQLGSAEAVVGRQFLDERGFDAAAAAHFGVGFAPNSWDTLTRHLRSKGFTDRELTVGGLSKEGQRGLIDRFRGRLVWPIRDITGETIGFGARKLLEDDQGPKYLNTSETPIYRKSQVLYGIDLAKRAIAQQRKAVIVEGYTDVMACHLAGIETAIATCGTAFGGDHVKILRRLLMDNDTFGGQVVFTFDGDAAGQKAAMRAFEDDQRFVAQTFVAVEPHGLDPCELRQKHGDAAVVALVDKPVPLFEFAIRSVLAGQDLEQPAGRVAALRAAAPVVAQIRDHSLRPEYARSLAGWLGMEIKPVQDAVTQANRALKQQNGPRAQSAQQATAATEAAAPTPRAVPRPDPNERRLVGPRELLKLAVQHPGRLDASFDALPANMFSHPAYVQVRTIITTVGGVATADGSWMQRLTDAAPDDSVRSVINELAVEPIQVEEQSLDRYAREQLGRAHEQVLTLQIDELRSKMQRLESEDPAAHSAAFADLVALETDRRKIREVAFGGD
ncbi:MAG: DNA primase [Actinomycetia bacterium]|nr:DNA primase [Actinomycetes bacterium]